jgi:hypothetical protein
MIIKSRITWKNGKTTERNVDYGNAQERKRFACVARAALEEGGCVETFAVDRNHVEPLGTYSCMHTKTLSCIPKSKGL